MSAQIKAFLRESILYPLLHPIYKFLLYFYDILRTFLFTIFPTLGLSSYNSMQIKEYKNYSNNFNNAMELCVGNFQAHEAYPYEKYLMERYKGERKIALDFACGMGRMMNRFMDLFDKVDGVDLSLENITYAKQYLEENGHSEHKFDLYQSTGMGVSIDKKDYYDFIFSTIALQHISVYEIRKSIFKDLLSLLKPGGSCCFQMGFGWDNGNYWFSNKYTARSTNGGDDVSIPDDSHLAGIKKHFEDIGFKNVEFKMELSPHPEMGNNYHPIWLFIHLDK